MAGNGNMFLGRAGRTFFSIVIKGGGNSKGAGINENAGNEVSRMPFASAHIVT